MIHGPSLGIGAVVASVVIVAVFLGFSSITSEQELEMEKTPVLEQAEQQITTETFFENGSPTLGSQDAPIVLVEFGDYQCHFCNVFFHDTEKAILENYVNTGKVRMIFKDYTIIGQDSVNAAHGAHCAGDQEKFWEYHDILYNNWTGENNGWAASENLLGFAQEIGLDTDTWSECMLEKRHSQKIVASNQDARTLKLGGTPAFFVIGHDGRYTSLSGAQSFEVFEKIFENELKK